MFSGIIEAMGEIEKIEEIGGGRAFYLKAPWAGDLAQGESVALDGVCTTVTEAGGGAFRIFASEQTCAITNLGARKAGQRVNLERSLQLDARVSGHFVYGHVDARGPLQKIETGASSWVLEFGVPSARFMPWMIPKGSVAINGISLTVYEIRSQAFAVMIIPHTWEKTNLSALAIGESANLEFDFMGKYAENFFRGARGRFSGGPLFA
ncbi:MAG: riboflavin synthase [Spirochaetes bacterium]|nr:riboflavin synthase [Spirochaetota bacterium]